MNSHQSLSVRLKPYRTADARISSSSVSSGCSSLLSDGVTCKVGIPLSVAKIEAECKVMLANLLTGVVIPACMQRIFILIMRIVRSVLFDGRIVIIRMEPPEAGPVYHHSRVDLCKEPMRNTRRLDDAVYSHYI